MINQSTLPRGIRNNNPGNLIFVPVIRWEGQTGADPTGKAVFSSPELGIRAATINLLTGFLRDGRDTLREIITRWAPSHENPTDSYMQFMSDAMGVSIDQPIALVPENIEALVRGIGHFENGAPLTRWYSDRTISEGVRLGLEQKGLA